MAATYDDMPYDQIGGSGSRDKYGYTHGDRHAYVHNFLPPQIVGGKGGSMWDPELNQDFDFDAYDIHSKEFWDEYMGPYFDKAKGL